MLFISSRKTLPALSTFKVMYAVSVLRINGSYQFGRARAFGAYNRWGINHKWVLPINFILV